MIHWHDRVASTMDQAHALAGQGAPHGTAVAARTQEKARGRLRRPWLAPEGGLWLSVLGRPEAVPESLSLRIGLRVAGVLERAIGGGGRIAIKEPNDLYLDGAKLGGILVEVRWTGSGTRPAWAVVGIGINVANPPPAGLEIPVTSLAAHGFAVTPEALAAPVADAVAGALLDRGELTGPEREELARRRLDRPGPAS